MKPEEKARKVIDKLFAASGWQVVDREHYAPNISAAAIEEGLLNHNMEADYLFLLTARLSVYSRLKRRRLMSLLIGLRLKQRTM